MVKIFLNLENYLAWANRRLLVIAIVLHLSPFIMLLVRVEKVFFFQERTFILNFITHFIIAWVAITTRFSNDLIHFCLLEV